MTRPTRILVATDFSDHAETALDTAIALGKRFGARVDLVHALDIPLPVFEPFAVSLPAGFVEGARDSARERLGEGMARIQAAGLEGEAHLGDAPPSRAIADCANEIGADLVIVGTHGRTGIPHLLVGSVAERTAAHSPCSILAVKKPLSGVPATLVVGTDFSEGASRALDAACEFAEAGETALHVVHAIDLNVPAITPYEMVIPNDLVEKVRTAALERAEGVVASVRERGFETAEAHVVPSPPSRGVSDEAERLEADLVVTGSRGLTGLKHALLGSVAERTLRHAPCSVLIVREPEA